MVIGEGIDEDSRIPVALIIHAGMIVAFVSAFLNLVVFCWWHLLLLLLFLMPFDCVKLRE